MVKEVDDALLSKVSESELSVLTMYNGICQDITAIVASTLQVTHKILATTDMVGVVAEGLHQASLHDILLRVLVARVGIELGVVA